MRPSLHIECTPAIFALTSMAGGDKYGGVLICFVFMFTQPSGWRKLRNIVQWTPFFQTYKKQRYPWVQLAGHQGNFKAGPDQGTILKKLCEKEEKCFKVRCEFVFSAECIICLCF